MKVSSIYLIPKHISEFHHLPGVGPKQLCVLAHLGFTREGTSLYCISILCLFGLSKSEEHKFTVIYVFSNASFDCRAIQLGPMKTAPLLNKYY